MKRIWKQGSTSSMQLAIAAAAWLLVAGEVRANVSVTAASGGGSLPTDRAADATSPAWTSLGAITIGEPNNGTGDIGAGTLILQAPTGFEFNTAVTPSISFTAGRNITAASVLVSSSTQITISLSVNGILARDALTVGSTTGLQVRPVTGTVLSSGRIYRPETGGGTATILGVTAGPAGTSFGTLGMVVGAANRLDLEVAPPAAATAGSAFSVQPRVAITDQFGHVITSADSTVVRATAVGGTANLTGATNVTSANGIVNFSNLGYNRAETISVAFSSGTLIGTNSGPITVSPAAADRLVFAVQPDSGDYTGTLTPNPVVQSRDPYGNVSTLGVGSSKLVNLVLSSGTGSLQGVVPQDIGTAAGNGSVTFSNISLTAAGTNKRLTASAAGLSSGVSAVFTINPLLVTGAVTIASRPYNGTNTATILTRTLTGVLPGESCDLAGGTATFADKHVGTNKLVTVVGLGLSGTHAGNYQLVSTTATNVASIAKAGVAVSADNKIRPYGGANPLLTATYYGLAPGENLTNSGITGLPALNTTATPVDPLGDYVITAGIGSLAASNYAFNSFTNGTLTITKAPLQVVADSKWKPQGSANPPLTATFSGFVNGDSEAVLSGSPNLSTTATTGSGVGTYPITVTAGSLSATNYAFNFVNGTLSVLAQGTLWYDNFARSTQPPGLDPWQVQAGVWTITNGLLRGGTNLLSRYSHLYVSNTWSNASVQGRFQFPAGSYGGGLGARLTPTNGARYAAWIYPSGSPGGSNVVKLLKFGSWAGFAWSNQVSLPMGVAQVPSVGTGTNTLKLAFHGSQVAVHFNGSRVLSVNDPEVGANRLGGISLEQWTDTNAYVMTVDEVLVSNLAAPVASNNTYVAVQNTTLSVPAPGIVGNDRSEVYDLTPILVNGPGKGVLTLATNGGFTYTPNPGAIGSDSFTYRATDGVATSGVATVTLNLQTNSPPVAVADNYTAFSGAALIISAPGVLANDTDPEAQPLTAILQSGPANGNLTLGTNGGFTYTPFPGFVGADSFAYRATDMVNTSAPVNVTFNVIQPTALLNETFTRATNPAPITPWVAQSGNWSITGGKLVGGTNALLSYGIAYLNTNWSDFSVEGRITFPAGAYGGGLSGRVNPATGARYAAWIYPEGSPGGSKVLKLLKFPGWTSFGTLAQVALPNVGTTPRTLKIAFQGNRIGVLYDGVRMINVTDTDPSPPLNGGVGTEFWTDATGYQPTFDDIVVRLPAAPRATNDVYNTVANGVLSVPAAGVLANDFAEVGTLTAVLMGNPTNGSVTLTNNGGFRYTPNAGFAGLDSFTYQATDGLATSTVATVSILVGSNSPPTANNDALAAMAGVPLIVSAPGVLANDTDPDGQTLSAVLVSGPTNGAFSFAANGGLTYTAPAGYLGGDSFTYRATDGVLTSGVATVTISVSAAGPLFSENFTRANDPAPISPWTVFSGSWVLTGGLMRGGPNPPNSGYAYAFLSTNWADYVLEGKVRLGEGAYGGGLGGRLNPVTGSHYAVWLYPSGSGGGSNVLKLLKFTSWATFGYTNANSMPMGMASIPDVGTNWHTLKIAFQGNAIQVTCDGVTYLNVVDLEPVPLASGGISAEFWTAGTPLAMEVDDISVTLPPATGGEPVFTGIRVAPNGGIVLVMQGEPNTQYVLQATPGLMPPGWSNLSTNTSDAGGSWSVTNFPGGVPARFYRAFKP